jgi:arsenite methyltransferase
MQKSDVLKNIVKSSYANIVKSSSGCCCSSKSDSNQKAQKQSGQIGYSEYEISQAPKGSNLGLGCGNPTAIASLREGEIVLDLGSGAGFDTFLASPKVGKTGKVIGIDITQEMLEKARENAKKGGYTNVEFRKGDIENLPVEDNLVDVVISNCVINLAPDKEKFFSEIYRVLRQGGRLMVSDTVLIKPLPENLKNDKDLLVGCVSGAILKNDYLNLLKKVGFFDITIHKESEGFLKDYGQSITYSAIK